MRRRVLIRSVVVVAVVAVVGTGTASAQAAPVRGTVRSARMVADLTGADGSARVRIEYVLDGVSAGTTVDASVLAFGSAKLEGLKSGDASVAVRALPGVAGAARLTTSPGDDAGTVRITATYEVSAPMTERGAALRGFIPVLSVDARPGEARPGLFRADLVLPASWTLSESFPTGLAPDGDTPPGARTWTVDLAVVPSVVSFRAHPDARWHPGLPLILDVLAGAILLAFSVVGWGHLRRIAA